MGRDFGAGGRGQDGVRRLLKQFHAICRCHKRKGFGALIHNNIDGRANNIFNGVTTLEAYMTNQPDFRTLPVNLPEEELKNPTMAVMDGER